MSYYELYENHLAEVVSNVLDQSHGGPYTRENATYTPFFGLFGPIRVPFPQGLKCLFNPLQNHYFVQ